MTKQRISKYISALISILLPLGWCQAQVTGQTLPKNRTMGVQYIPDRDSIKPLERPIHTLEGMSVSIDAAGAVMYALANYGQLEGSFRLNLKERYFPIVEIGIGHSDHTDDNTSLHFKTNSPYFRMGCDYNFAKDLRSGNRVFGGVRYAYTKIKYDLDGPDLTDPIWGQSVPYSFRDLDGSCSWGEAVFGIEAKIWNNFHIGWSVRYRLRLSQNVSDVGQAWYIPGYGKNEGHTFGATFNLIFDI